jgi:hypothetical protein
VLLRFVGVELSLRITSSSYLLPTSTSQQDAAQQPLLVGHKQRFAHLFGAAAPSSDAPNSSSSSCSSSNSSSYAALQQSLQSLRSDLHKGLLQQRMELTANARFQRWQGTDEGRQAGAAALGGSAASKLPEQQLQDAVARQVEDSGLLAADSDSSSAVSASREQALLSAVDKLLGSFKTQGLDRWAMLVLVVGQGKTCPCRKNAGPLGITS